MTGATAYDAMFARLTGKDERAFVPFTVLGDPDPGTSLEIVRTLAESGADALELGIPFSDPVADGPAIQAADARALGAGTRVADAWRIIETVRADFGEMPIGLLVYANLVVCRGADAFYPRAAAAGVDSVLVADAPLVESEPLERAAAAAAVAAVLIAPPNASDAALRAIGSRSRGYVYVTSRPGVTGAETARLRSDADTVIRRLDELSPEAPPPLVGFGIGRPAHVRQVVAMGAAGAISGSAIARLIERGGDRGTMLARIADFVRAMKKATLGTVPVI
ncbi:MAG: tryptophan synthase subunit alpha [Acidobacteriota bacterium]|nr:tryptophan synthase subunit alpha [Acidobacteriota bacterium]